VALSYRSFEVDALEQDGITFVAVAFAPVPTTTSFAALEVTPAPPFVIGRAVAAVSADRSTVVYVGAAPALLSTPVPVGSCARVADPEMLENAGCVQLEAPAPSVEAQVFAPHVTVAAFEESPGTVGLVAVPPKSPVSRTPPVTPAVASTGAKVDGLLAMSVHPG
jgi:hypothetical protein